MTTETNFKIGDRVRVIVAEPPFTELGDTGTVKGTDHYGFLGVALDKRQPVDEDMFGCYWLLNNSGEIEVEGINSVCVVALEKIE